MVSLWFCYRVYFKGKPFSKEYTTKQRPSTLVSGKTCKLRDLSKDPAFAGQIQLHDTNESATNKNLLGKAKKLVKVDEESKEDGSSHFEEDDERVVKKELGRISL